MPAEKKPAGFRRWTIGPRGHDPLPITMGATALIATGVHAWLLVSWVHAATDPQRRPGGHASFPSDFREALTYFLGGPMCCLVVLGVAAYSWRKVHLRRIPWKGAILPTLLVAANAGMLAYFLWLAS